MVTAIFPPVPVRLAIAHNPVVGAFTSYADQAANFKLNGSIHKDIYPQTASFGMRPAPAPLAAAAHH